MLCVLVASDAVSSVLSLHPIWGRGQTVTAADHTLQL